MPEPAPVPVLARARLGKKPAVGVRRTPSGRRRDRLLLVALVLRLVLLRPHVLVPDVFELPMGTVHAVATDVRRATVPATAADTTGDRVTATGALVLQVASAATGLTGQETPRGPVRAALATGGRSC